MNYHEGRNSGPLDGGEEIRGPVNFVHPCNKTMELQPSSS